MNRVCELSCVREAALILQAYDTCIPDGEGSYLAAPISTGLRYYELLATHRLTEMSELVDRIGQEKYLQLVRWPNVQEGEEVAARLRRTGVLHLINTGPLFISGWSVSNYMELCFELIKRKVRTVYFHPDWAYSAGAVKEYLFCSQRKLNLLTIDGEPLAVDAAMSALEGVSTRLQALGLTAKTQNDARRLLSDRNRRAQPVTSLS
jgi:hypothetical protein